MTRTWLIVGTLWTVIVLVAGAVGAWLWLASPQIQKDSEQRVFATPERLRINLERGTVRLIAADTGEISVDRQLEWTENRPIGEEELTNGVLTLDEHCPSGPSWRSAFMTDCAIHYVVRVSRDVVVEVNTQQADVHVQGITADSTITTTSGDVVVDDAGGSVAVRTITGRVSTIDSLAVRTDVATETGNVDLSFTVPPHEVFVRTRSGDTRITVPQPDSYQLLLGVTSGRQTIRVGQNLNAEGAIAAESVSGDVSVVYAEP